LRDRKRDKDFVVAAGRRAQDSAPIASHGVNARIRQRGPGIAPGKGKRQGETAGSIST
jgi:hypothetical protein